MKRFILFPFLLILFSSYVSAAEASFKKHAIGGWLQGGNSGEHAGLDYKYLMAPLEAIDVYASFLFRTHDNSLGIYIGYYWFFDLIKAPTNIGKILLYAGPTGGVGFWDEELWHSANKKHYDQFGIAIRAGAVGGIEWDFPIPLEIYLEVSPVGELHFIFDDYRDDTTDWKIPDFYLRLGLRYQF